MNILLQLLLPKILLPLTTVLCFGTVIWSSYWLLENEQSPLGKAFRDNVKTDLQQAQERVANARVRAKQAEERRERDAKRLEFLRAEVCSHGSEEERASRLGSSDDACTRAAERAWHSKQAARAEEKCAQYAVRTQELRSSELPGLVAQVEGLEEALEHATSEMQQVEAERLNVNMNADQIGKELQHLRTHHNAQKELLVRMEGELQALRESAEESKKRLLEEAAKQLREMDRAAIEGSRTLKWTRGLKRVTEADNNVCQAALVEINKEKEALEVELESMQQHTAEIEEEFDTVKQSVERKEAALREKQRADRMVEKQKEAEERMKDDVEKLKSAIKLLRTKRDKAEREVVKAEVDKQTRVAKAERVEHDVDERVKSSFAELEILVQNCNIAIGKLRETQSSCVGFDRTHAMLSGKLEESGRTIVELREARRIIVEKTQADEHAAL